MVAAGFGVALAPRLALQGIRPGVSVLTLKAPAPERRILLVRMSGAPQTPVAAAFTDIILNCAAS
jgi:DNA-binding transcriptional LysR family regulator